MTRLVRLALCLMLFAAASSAAEPALGQSQGDQVWVLVVEPTETFTAVGDPGWIAAPGEWYYVLLEEAGWVLAAWELDSPDLAVWLQVDERVQRVFVAAPRYPRVRSPEYGMNIFIWGAPQTTRRDLNKLQDAQFTWQKTLFQWRLIEPEKGLFQWAEADRVVKASNEAKINVIARVDFQPRWARADGAHNGPPDRYEDYADFLFTLADHFKPGSPNGTIAAIELWNEPNLSREWANLEIGAASAADYVRLMCIGHEATKRASPNIITVSAGLSPTGTMSSDAADDTVYLQWMYDAGAQPCFDVLGAHGAGYKAPPWISPEELADPQWGGHPSFGFRRVEQIREVMVQNGDAEKQVWLLEFGWTSDPINPSYAWHRVTEEQKAEYLVEAFRWAYDNWQPWIGVMTAWNMPAPDWTPIREEYWWSITAPDGTNRPAFVALVRARQDGYLP